MTTIQVTTATTVDAFNAVVFRMEQHPGEIHPFAEWLYARKPHNVLEIGVRQGGTAALWHGLSTGKVIGIDYGGCDSLGEENTLSLADKMMSLYPRYTFVYGDSHEPTTLANVRGILHGDQLDFLFLDGDHSYAGIEKDFDMYRSLVVPGGCIAFHDIVDSELIRAAGHGVYQFWRELYGDKVEFCIGSNWGGIGAWINS